MSVRLIALTLIGAGLVWLIAGNAYHLFAYLVFVVGVFAVFEPEKS